MELRAEPDADGLDSGMRENRLLAPNGCQTWFPRRRGSAIRLYPRPVPERKGIVQQR